MVGRGRMNDPAPLPGDMGPAVLQVGTSAAE